MDNPPKAIAAMLKLEQGLGSRMWQRRVSDTSPRNQAALKWDAAKPKPREPQPGEVLFEFDLRGSRIRCELREQGAAGCDCQFFSDGNFLHSRRCPDRALAGLWAADTRAALEKG